MALLLLTSPVWASSIDTPSGQDVTLSEILHDENPGQLWVRFRFLAPEIARDGPALDANVAAADMMTLCDQIAAPYVVSEGLMPERIVISLSDRFVPFGQPDADATQFFELYSLQDGVCIWEEF